MEDKRPILCGCGNAGVRIVEACGVRELLSDCTLYGIDSQTNQITLNNIARIKYIPIIGDIAGSGRSREKGKALYEFHESEGAFDDLYKACEEAKSPIIVISSTGGGTGSGTVPSLCKALIDRGLSVIPILVAPNDEDPYALQMNSEDCFLELDEVGVTTYSVFKNMRNDADYTVVNNDIVEQIEIILGKRYKNSPLDTIDPSDLNVVLSAPGRLMTISAKAPDIPSLKKELTRKMMTGFQPAFTPEEAEKCTFVTAFSLESTFAQQDFKEVFEDINSRIKNVYDEYRNIVVTNTAGDSYATAIIAGLPTVKTKNVSADFLEANTIGAGKKKNSRPSFISKRKATITQSKGDGASKQFNWK